MEKLLKIPFCLNLFGDEGAISQSGTTAEGNPETLANEGEPQVIYGIQEEEKPDAEFQNDNPEEKKEESFEELIKGKYKEEYEKRVQSAIKRRFGADNGLKEEIKAQNEVLELLFARYGVSDLASLKASVEKDEGYLEEMAEQTGMDIETVRDMQRIKMENLRMNKIIAENQQRNEAQRQARLWRNEASEVKGIYPDFDLEAELLNKDFTDLIQNNIPMRKAYEIVHLDELTSGVAMAAAKDASQKTAERIRSRGLRPKENAGTGSSGVLIKNNPKTLSRAEREEIIRRAARGEKIAF